MSDDFPEDDDSFFLGGDETPKDLRPLGLVVPPIARQIINVKTGEVVLDEVSEWERVYRKNGRPPVTFIEADE